MARQIKKNVGKKTKKTAANGVAHIQSTFNNTIVTISTTNGETVSWASSGAIGFKGAKKGTPFPPVLVPNPGSVAICSKPLQAMARSVQSRKPSPPTCLRP